MSFDALIGKLGTLSKAQPLDDAKKDDKIAAAAADGAAASAAASAKDGKGAKKSDCDDEDIMGKSMVLVLENGEEMEGFDGVELMKSMFARVKAAEKQVQDVEAGSKDVMSKAIEIIGAQGVTMTALQKSLAEQATKVGEQEKLIGEQTELIKSLRTDLDALRSEPAGRKSAQNPAQVKAESPLAKSLQNGEGEGMKPQEFLAKCLTLQKAGKMTMQEVCYAETAIQNGIALPASTVSKVFSSK